MTDIRPGLAKVAAIVERRERDPDSLPLFAKVDPEEIRAALEAEDFERGMPLDDAVERLSPILDDGLSHAPHPRHFGIPRNSTDPIGVLGDCLTAAYDPHLGIYEFAPAAHEIEDRTLRFFAGRFGYDDGDWHFTSGGQEANLTGVIVALTEKFAAFREHGVRGLDRQPTFYVSEEAHHSFDKVAHATGLGRAAIRRVPVDGELRMIPDALRELIRRDRDGGEAPFLVVATTGSTTAGAVDNVADVSDVAAAEGLWLHADAALGGVMTLADAPPEAFRHFDRADSISFDAHKWLNATMGTGMYFTRRRGACGRAFGVDATYAKSAHERYRPPAYGTSMQFSRRFIGLKVHLMLAVYGRSGLWRVFERMAAHGDRLRADLVADGWGLANRTPLPIVAFDPDPSQNGHDRQDRIVADLRRDPGYWISTARVAGGASVLRAAVTSRATTEEHVAGLTARLRHARDAVTPARAGS